MLLNVWIFLAILQYTNSLFILGSRSHKGPTNPNDSYAPFKVECPPIVLTRTANSV